MVTIRHYGNILIDLLCLLLEQHIRICCIISLELLGDLPLTKDFVLVGLTLVHFDGLMLILIILLAKMKNQKVRNLIELNWVIFGMMILVGRVLSFQQVILNQNIGQRIVSMRLWVEHTVLHFQ